MRTTRGARKEYKPFWSEDLQKLEDTVSDARKIAEEEPSTMYREQHLYK
jgi:hypothetical protein